MEHGIGIRAPTMPSVQIKGVDLAKVIRNAMLWQDPGVSWTKGRVLLSFAGSELSLYSTDGYTAARDHVAYAEELQQFSTGKTWEFWFSEREMEVFLLMAVDSKTGPLSISWDTEHVTLPYGYDVKYEDPEKAKNPENLKETGIVLTDGTSFFGEPTDFPEWAEALEEALETAEDPQAGERQLQLDVALRPERIRKLLNVRADREAPVDFRFLTPMNANAGPMAAVKIGATFRALVNFVHRQTARENLVGEQKDFLW